MDNEKNQNPIKQNVLEAIQSGEVRSLPRWHFVLRGALAFLGALLVLLTLLYLVSFEIFVLRQSGIWFAPSFGGVGWLVLFRELPWLLLGVSLVFLIVLEVLVRRYSFAYSRPILYSLLGVLGFVFFVGYFTAPFHKKPFSEAANMNLPVAGSFYRGFGPKRARDVARGEIVATSTHGFIIYEINGATSSIIIGPRTKFRIRDGVTVGDVVVVFGRRDEERIVAQGVLPIAE